jgi:hypothetical protein
VNPYAIIAALVVAGLALFGADRHGQGVGRAEQAQTDQVKIDGKDAELRQVASDLAAEKAQASALLAAAARKALDDSQAAARLRQQQELDHANDQARTEAARRAFADAVDRRVRELAAGGQAAAVPAGRGSGGGPVPAAADATGPAGAPAVQLSVEGVRNLGTMFLDCDALADNYRIAYTALYPAWRPPLIPPDAPASSAAPAAPASAPGDAP